MNKISKQILLELLDCDPIKGTLRWKRRSESWFSHSKNPGHWCKIWNARYAGKRAGHRCKDGTRTVRVLDKAFLEHRIIWIMTFGELNAFLDHKKGQEAGNSIKNLRIATQSQNMANSKKRADNNSGFKGVSFDSFTGKYVARIRVPFGKYENLGRFRDPAMAAKAYRKRAAELHGEFARFE